MRPAISKRKPNTVHRMTEEDEPVIESGVNESRFSSRNNSFSNVPKYVAGGHHKRTDTMASGDVTGATCGTADPASNKSTRDRIAAAQNKRR